MTSELPVALIGVLLALWLVGAAVAIWTGLSLRRRSLRSLQQSARLARLLETAPAFPVLVKGDGRIEAAERFSRLLGLPKTAASLAELAGADDAGLAGNDLAALEECVRETQRTGKAFIMPLAVQSSDRRLLVKGSLADAVIYPNGAALLWFFDSTDSLRELEDLRREWREARTAFDALAGLIEAAPIPMWHRGPDMRLAFVNRAYVDAVDGNDGAQVVDDGVELLEAEQGVTAAQRALQVLEAGQTQESVVSTTLNGHRRQLRVFDIPLGKAGVAGLAIDVQDLSNARQEFRQLSDAQRDLLNMMSAGVAQFDAEQVLTFANLPFQRLFAFRDQWLTERPEFVRVLDRMRENGKLPEVRDFPAWRSDHQDWFRQAEPSEEHWLLPDGVHLRVLAQPVPDGGLLLIFEDRTEHAQLASARDTLLRVRTATFDNLFEAIAVFAADGRLSIWNRLFAETWGLSEDILITHPRIDELLPLLAGHLKKPSQISIIGELIRMTTANREQRRSRATFADGRIFQIASIPLPDGNALLLMLDMSDSMKIEQALRDRNSALLEADAIKGRFLANMSYEFRTPLTTISGFADLLKAGIAGELNEQAKDYVEAIATSAARLSDQINTVLDYSQSEAGALPIDKREVDAGAFLNEVIAAKAELARDEGVNLIAELDLLDGPVVIDARRLGQAVGQVIDNAIRHNGRGGNVAVIASVEQARLVVTVSDDGPGISAPKQAALFDGSDRSSLGLLLARQLVESHGGEFALRSREGQGTVVTISVPRE